MNDKEPNTITSSLGTTIARSIAAESHPTGIYDIQDKKLVVIGRSETVIQTYLDNAKTAGWRKTNYVKRYVIEKRIKKKNYFDRDICFRHMSKEKQELLLDEVDIVILDSRFVRHDLTVRLSIIHKF